MSFTTPPKLVALLFAAVSVVAWLAPNALAATDKLAGNHSETLLTGD